MFLLNKDFIKWVIVAFLIATPIAWYVMHRWLQSFVYKTQQSWWNLWIGWNYSAWIALLTISWQSWSAATKNPVEALRMNKTYSFLFT